MQQLRLALNSRYGAFPVDKLKTDKESCDKYNELSKEYFNLLGEYQTEKNKVGS